MSLLVEVSLNHISTESDQCIDHNTVFNAVLVNNTRNVY